MLYILFVFFCYTVDSFYDVLFHNFTTVLLYFSLDLILYNQQSM